MSGRWGGFMWVCRQAGTCEGGVRGVCVHAALCTFLLNQTFGLKWLSTLEQPAGLSAASKLYLVIYTEFVYCTVCVYKQRSSNLPNLSEGILEAAFGA